MDEGKKKKDEGVAHTLGCVLAAAAAAAEASAGVHPRTTQHVHTLRRALPHRQAAHFHRISSLLVTSRRFSSLLITPRHFSSLLVASRHFSSLLATSFHFYSLLVSSLLFSSLPRTSWRCTWCRRRRSTSYGAAHRGRGCASTPLPRAPARRPCGDGTTGRGRRCLGKYEAMKMKRREVEEGNREKGGRGSGGGGGDATGRE